MLKKIKDLCQIPAVSGGEEKVRAYLIKKIEGKANHEVDALGNLIVYKKGKKAAKNKVMLAAHMDEIGLIINLINDEGFLKFIKVGGIDTAVLLGRSVEIGDKAVKGFIGVKPIHLLKEEEKHTFPEDGELYIDIGAKSREDALKHVSLGDLAVLESQPTEFGTSLLKARALDDRAGCALLLHMIEQESQYDLTFAFTVQEEVGLRGAKTAAWALEPDYALVVEATTAADIAGVEAEKEVCSLGKGAVVSFMDRATVYDREMYKKAFELAEKHGIKIQPKAAVAGGNDAGAIHSAGGGAKTLAISLPCRYLHSASSTIDKNDLEEVYKLIVKLGEYYAND